MQAGVCMLHRSSPKRFVTKLWGHHSCIRDLDAYFFTSNFLPYVGVMQLFVCAPLKVFSSIFICLQNFSSVVGQDKRCSLLNFKLGKNPSHLIQSFRRFDNISCSVSVHFKITLFCGAPVWSATAICNICERCISTSYKFLFHFRSFYICVRLVDRNAFQTRAYGQVELIYSTPRG